MSAPDKGTPAILFFHGALKGLLPARVRAHGRIAYPVDRRASIKDVIEALGPPHTEIDRIVANEEEKDFGYLLKPGDKVEIYPVEPPMKVAAPAPLRPDPLPEIKFLVDVNAGKLATKLRLLGFDTTYSNSLDDAALAAQAAEEQRIVLSKDRALLKRKAITHGHLIRNEDPDRQLAEICVFFDLRPPFKPFSRCLRCNTPLVPVEKQTIVHRLLPLTKKYFNEFHICPDCRRIYWPGSHHEKMLALVERLKRL